MSRLADDLAYSAMLRAQRLAEYESIATKLRATDNEAYRKLGELHAPESYLTADYQYCSYCKDADGISACEYPCETMKIVIFGIDDVARQESCGGPHSSIRGGAL